MTDAGSRPERIPRAPVLRRLGAAVFVSGAVHSAVIALGRVELPEPPGHLPPLAVRLVDAAPPPAPAVVHSPPAPVSRAVRVAPRAAAVVSSAPLAQVSSDLPAAAEAAPALEVPAERPADPVVVATAPPPTYAPEPPPALPSFPRTGRITFTLVYGRDNFPVGRTVQSWKIEGTRYELASRSETIGIVDLFRSQYRTYSSHGELTPAGLRPETFMSTRERGRGPEDARAQFDWANGSVALGARAPRKHPLPAGSQDLMSFVYQLALDPPRPGRMRVTVTNGSRLENYELDVMSEEKIETPLGVLRGLPVRQVRTPGEQSVDVWLATEYRHLPVRIRFYGRDGEPTGEQLVTEIRLSDE